MSKIKVAICDDNIYLCEGYKSKFNYEEDLDFVGAAHDSSGCVEMVNEKKPDVLLLDIQMETETAGVDVIPKLKEICAEMKIIMLTSYSDEDYVFSAFVNGADDYIIKTLGDTDTMDTIRNVYNNQSMLRPEIAKTLTKKTKEMAESQKSLLYLVNIMVKLSTSEFEVLKAIYNGDSYKVIAKKRFVEECTIRTLASRILKKFEVDNMKVLVKNLRETNIFEMFDK